MELELQDIAGAAAFEFCTPAFNHQCDMTRPLVFKNGITTSAVTNADTASRRFAEPLTSNLQSEECRKEKAGEGAACMWVGSIRWARAH